MNKNILQGQIPIPSACYQMIARELWWTNQEFSYVNIIIPPCISMLIYHLRDEQQARWWRQFKDIVLLHWHDHHNQVSYCPFHGSGC
jgi:hypothetical protein